MPTLATTSEQFLTLSGEVIDLDDLTPEQRTFLVEARERAARWRDDCRFSNYWRPRMERLHSGLTRREITKAALYRILQDIESRLMIAQGDARMEDYQDELARLIRRKYRSQYQVCKEIGIDPSYLSQVLNRKKHFSLPKLEQLLWRLGYRLKFEPIGEPLDFQLTDTAKVVGEPEQDAADD